MWSISMQSTKSHACISSLMSEGLHCLVLHLPKVKPPKFEPFLKSLMPHILISWSSNAEIMQFELAAQEMIQI